jgi:dTDP-glucose 4,6-dehydratase
VAGDGAQTRSLCYVDDLVDGVLAIAASGLSGPVNIGNPDEASVLSIAERIRAACRSSAPIRFTDRPADDPQLRCPDITRLRTELGWQPSTEFDTGIARTIAWFAAESVSPEHRETPELHRAPS